MGWGFPENSVNVWLELAGESGFMPSREYTKLYNCSKLVRFLHSTATFSNNYGFNISVQQVKSNDNSV